MNHLTDDEEKEDMGCEDYQPLEGVENWSGKDLVKIFFLVFWYAVSNLSRQTMVLFFFSRGISRGFKGTYVFVRSITIWLVFT